MHHVDRMSLNANHLTNFGAKHIRLISCKENFYLKKYFFGVPHLATCIFYNEPELGAEINPAMALTPLSSSIGQG